MSNIRIASNAGFCFGVQRAVDAVYEIINSHKYDRIYTLGELIHNSVVIADLKSNNVNIIDSIDDLDNSDSNDVVIIRSHGVSKSTFDALHNKNKTVLDLTCPFVNRIHCKVYEYAGKNLIIIGDKYHPEVIGIKGWSRSENVYIVNSRNEVDELPQMSSALVVAQTTSSYVIWDELISELKSKINSLIEFKSICDTTDKRQREAEKLASESSIVIVVGDKNSSNTNKLFELCNNQCKNVYLVGTSAELNLDNICKNDIISIVAGASAPKRIIMEVFKRMAEVVEQGTQEVNNLEENVNTNVDDKVNNVVAEANDENDFASQLEKTYVYIKRGQLVTGTVIQISENELWVSIGYKSDGIIKKENLSVKGDENPMDLFKVGDSIDAEVIALNDGEGNVALSRKSIESKLRWKNLVEDLDLSKTYTVKIDKVVKGGVTSKFEGYEAFIPASQMSLKYVEDLSEFVGQDLEVKILDVDKKQKRFVLSRKEVLQKEADEKEKELYASFNKGDKVKGTVKRITDFGAFVDIGGVDGLLHITDVSWVKVKHPSDVLKHGEELEVLILNVDSEKKRVSLGLKQLTPKPWDLAPEKYPVGSEIEGTVVRILPFGAFVSLEPTIDGLVHVSQITNRRLEKVEEVLRIGDVVRAKVMGVDVAKKRITLSIRALLPEEEKKEVVKETSEDNFKYEIPPVDSATSTLGDFFPKMDE